MALEHRNRADVEQLGNMANLTTINVLMLVLWFDEVPGGWTYFKEMAQRLVNSELTVIVLSPRAKFNRREEDLNDIHVYRYLSIHVPRIPPLLIEPFSL